MTDSHLCKLAAFAARLPSGGVPDDVAGAVRLRIADTLGVSIAAQRLDTSQAAVVYALSRGGASQAHILGQRILVPMESAAFVNGVLAHSLDYDDTHLPSVLHPSACVVPAALAVAEGTNASWERVIAGVAAGLEITVRIGMAGYDAAAKSSHYFDYGQHATSMCGAIGAAAAAGVVFGFDAEHIEHAMAIAVSFASGVIEGNRVGGTVKRLHCGWAAQAGVSAAQLAAAGFTGPSTALEGRFGFFHAFLRGTYDAVSIDEGLGTRWSIPSICVKPYPANHFTHSGVDAAIRLRERDLDVDDIESIELGIPTATVRSIGEPIEVKRRPQTGYQGQFSGPYTVVAALLGGSGLGLGLADFDDTLVTDQHRRELMARVSVVSDPLCDQIFPDELPAVLRVRTRSGGWLVEKVLTSRGGPSRPLSMTEVATKLEDNVRDWVDPSAVTVFTGMVTGNGSAMPPVESLMTATLASSDSANVHR